MTTWVLMLCLSAGLLFAVCMAEECIIGACFCQDCISPAVVEQSKCKATDPGCMPFPYPNVNVTLSGRKCQRWDQEEPHSHSQVDNIDDDGQHNYCRNPDNESEGPWCYTTDPDKRWEFCFEVCEGASPPPQENWREQILKDVTHVCCYYPGKMLVYGPNAQAILTYDENVNTVGVAAAQLGQGRLIVFAHGGFMNSLKPTIEGGTGTPDHVQLGKNLAGWLLRDTSITSVSSSQTKDISDLTDLDSVNLQKIKIIFWKGSSDKSAEFIEKVKDYVNSGGALFLAVNSWNHGYSDPTYSNLPMNKLMTQAGITFMTGNGWGTNNEVAKNVAANAHIRKLLNDIVTKSVQEVEDHQLEPLRDIAEQLKSVKVPNFQSCIIPTYRAIFNSLKTPSSIVVPDNYKPPRKKVDRMLVVVNEVIHRYSEEDEGVIPGLEGFPGAFTTEPETTSVTLDITSPLDDYYATGYYAPAGQKVTVEVLSKMPADSRWKMWIGSHTDDVTDDREHYCRYPDVHEKTDYLPNGLTEIRNIFGGLIYFHGKEDTKSVLKVKLTGVVEAPYINTQDPASVADFERRRNAPGLWADIVGEYVTITVPSGMARELDAAKVLAVMAHWDEIMVEYHHLRGSNIRKTERQWMVMDMQSSYGYMHAGYPIVGQVLDHIRGGLSESSEPETLNYPLLLQEGSWGWYHELGHNMQKGWWTFDGQTEVTVNIFSRYVYYQIHGNYTLAIPRRDNSVRDGIEYLQKPCTDPYTEHGAWAGLGVHIQLIDAFGWEAYKKTFRQYWNLTDEELPDTNQQEIDQWVERLSKVVGFNLAPFYRFWCFPVSQSTADRVKDLPPWLPDDEVTRAVPDRTAATLQLYPKFDRVGSKVDNFPKTLDPVAAPHPWVKKVA